MPAGKKVVVVGSGLDRAKLDQIRRLCRRLRADACKAVDQHTTHVVVQVSQSCVVHQFAACIFQGKRQWCKVVPAKHQCASTCHKAFYVSVDVSRLELH